MVTPEEAKKISPLISTEGMLAASWSPHDGKATPESVVMGYAAAARRHGARIIRHCAVSDIDSSGGTITAVVDRMRPHCHQYRGLRRGRLVAQHR